MAELPFLMTAAELAAACGGRFVAAPGADASALGFSSVRIDSRACAAGSLFVALLGAERDGHEYIPAAAEKGAVLVLASQARAAEECARSGVSAVVVPDTLRGLQDAAKAYLDKFPGLLRIGITGSSGKTTTKELLGAMLGAERRTVMNVGNLNSETGLPLSVFEVRAEHEVGVFELGMNRRGEISELARVLRPSIALITNVGTAHIGILGSRQAIAEEKKAIFSLFTGAELALVPEDDDFVDFLCEGVKGRVLRYGKASTAGFGGERSLGLDGTELTWGGVPCVLALPGAHNARNALGAAAAAREAGVSDAAVRSGIAGAKALFGRAEILRGPATIVQDCYNANPESMDASLDFCDQVAWTGRRVYVIGSMLELGVRSEEEHAALGRRLAASKADEVFLFGAETEAAERALAGKKKCIRDVDFDRFSREVLKSVRAGDLVLLKGSRGVALERLTAGLRGIASPKEAGEERNPCS